MTSTTAILAVDDGFWDDTAEIAACLREALPRIPPWFGYDARGSELFEAITELPTYYLTRVEHALLARHAAQIADLLDCQRIAELGSGSAKKTRLLLAACLRRRPTTYLPIDVSRDMLESSAEGLRSALPGLQITALWGRYEAGLDRLAAEREPVVVAFLGSNLGNTTPGEREALLARIAGSLRPDDGFLVSVDLLKSAAEFETCYNDPPGHSAFAQFRLNHLTHLNRRFGATFALSGFRAHARYRAADEVVEGHVTALDDQQVAIPGLGLTLSLRRGDAINVGFSAKFDRDRFVADLAAHGLQREADWIDPERAYGLFLFRRR